MRGCGCWGGDGGHHSAEEPRKLKSEQAVSVGPLACCLGPSTCMPELPRYECLGWEEEESV